MLENEIGKAFDNLQLASLQRNLQPGRLGEDATTGDIVVADRPDHVWVRKGLDGLGGPVMAIDRAGVAQTNDIVVFMLEMNADWYILWATEYTAGAGSGVDELSELTDVVLTSLTDGDTIQYDSTSGTWVNVVASGSTGAPSPHDLSGAHHDGLLDWADLDKTGSSLADLATRNHSSLANVTANQHHNQVHALTGSDHTASGLTTGHVVRASGATTFVFAQLQHNDLGGVTANQHHNQQHVITGSDHTVTGAALDVVGLSGTNTLAVLTPSSNPGAAAAILRTSANGSLQLDTNLLYVDASNNRVGINQTPGNAALDVIVTTNADHTQRLKQKSGQTGRLWRIEDVAGNELIVLDSQGNLQSGSPGFVSGLTGWQVTPTGTLEANNVWVRGELHASVFVKDEIHATGGTMLVATAARMYSDATIDSDQVDDEELEFETEDGTSDWEVETEDGTETLEIEAVINYIEVEDSPTGPGFYFQEGDIIRSKTEVDTGITDFWFEVTGRQQMDGFQRYSVIKRSGTDGILPAGAALVSYGQEGDGRILLTSDLNFAPYIDVFTVGPEVWTGAAGSIVPRVRMGRLDGVGVTATSGIEQYGIIMGTDLSNANSPYIVASNLQLRLHKVDLTLNDGTNDTGELSAEGNLTLGTNIGTTEGKSFQVISTGSNAGDVIIGRVAGNYLRWDQSAATLTINGALQVGGSGVATIPYVDAGDTIAEENAQDYTDARESDIRTDLGVDITAAQTAAQAYGNARRVVGVTGTWTATDADTIAWTSAGVRFGDGTGKNLTNGNTGNMAARTYLYIDVTAATPLTVNTTTALTALGVNHALIAVCDPGTDKASISIVAGSTYISGDNIFTGSIVAANIKAASITGDRLVANTITANEIAANAITASEILAGAVTANKISVDGNIDIATTGAIRGNAKAYGSSTAGFFLGYHSAAYKFDIGDSNQFMRWDGSNLQLRTLSPPRFGTASTGAAAFELGNFSAQTLKVVYENGRVTFDGITPTTTELAVDGRFFCDEVKMSGSTMQIETKRTIATSGATGIEGEICWDQNYLYICTFDNHWRRISIPNVTW